MKKRLNKILAICMVVGVVAVALFSCYKFGDMYSKEKNSEVSSEGDIVEITKPILTPTSTPINTPTPIPTNTLTPTPSPTNTPTPIPSNTPTPTLSLTNTPVPTSTPVPTNTPIPTSTPVPTVMQTGPTLEEKISSNTESFTYSNVSYTNYYWALVDAINSSEKLTTQTNAYHHTAEDLKGDADQIPDLGNGWHSASEAWYCSAWVAACWQAYDTDYDWGRTNTASVMDVEYVMNHWNQAYWQRVYYYADGTNYTNYDMPMTTSHKAVESSTADVETMTKTYYALKALIDNGTVKAGDIIAFYGPNGALAGADVCVHLALISDKGTNVEFFNEGATDINDTTTIVSPMVITNSSKTDKVSYVSLTNWFYGDGSFISATTGFGIYRPK